MLIIIYTDMMHNIYTMYCFTVSVEFGNSLSDIICYIRVTVV